VGSVGLGSEEGQDGNPTLTNKSTNDLGTLKKAFGLYMPSSIPQMLFEAPKGSCG